MAETAATPASFGILADDPAYNATLAARIDDTDTLARVWIKPDGANSIRTRPVRDDRREGRREVRAAPLLRRLLGARPRWRL